MNRLNTGEGTVGADVLSMMGLTSFSPSSVSALSIDSNTFLQLSTSRSPSPRLGVSVDVTPPGSKGASRSKSPEKITLPTLRLLLLSATIQNALIRGNLKLINFGRLHNDFSWKSIKHSKPCTWTGIDSCLSENGPTPDKMWLKKN